MDLFVFQWFKIVVRLSIRGDIVDVYPPASNNPIRIEFYDNTIESLREFDVNSQVSLNVIDRVEILPVREVSPNEIQKGNGLDEIAILAKEHNVDPARLKELNDKIHHLKIFQAWRFWRHFFIVAVKLYLITFLKKH